MSQLPEPSAEARRHSEQLVAEIRRAMEEAGGTITFARFMELALYAPGLGYYSAGSRKLGSGGDFVTAPELSPLFGRCVARQCRQILAETGGDILEFGAGTGRLALDLLQELERLDALPGRYRILEVSADLRERQRRLLEEELPHLADRIEWIDQAPAGFTGVIVANEVLDAMPVHRFRLTGSGARELMVGWSGDRFVWQSGPITEPALEARLRGLQSELPLPEGFESEVGLAAERWTAALGDVLTRGAALLIDYGFPRHEFYHPERSGGTLMCHYRHHSHPDPFFLPGLQDLTAHIDFTAIAEQAVAAGLHVAGFANQANFLLGNGLAELVQTTDPAERLRQAGEVKRLTLPGEMGEFFKVIALTRDLELRLDGFALRDERVRL